MRQLVIVLLILTSTLVTRLHPAVAETDQTYRSDVLGLTFQYPADWVVREQLQSQSLVVASKADLEAVAAGKAPAGLLFSISVSSFRVIGVSRVEDFAPILAKITKATDTAPTPVTINGVEGLALDMVDTAQDVATRTLILSIGKRRVAIVRGVATIGVWTTGGGEGRFKEINESLNFFPPAGRTNADSFGRVLWQLPVEKLTDLADLTVSGDGATLYVTARTQGIWEVGANGTSRDIRKPDGIGAFGGVGLLRTGVLYIADSVNHEIWTVDLSSDKITRLLGGRLGSGRSEFGSNSPRYFAFGTKGQLYVLDENEKGLRIQIFSRTGEWTTTWDLKDIQPPVDSPVISSDNNGNVYIIGRNTAGIIKINGAGKIVTQDLGKEFLVNTGARSLIVDRFGNFYVATADQGILNLNAAGKLVGIIGDAYDEAAPPKPGQLGKPSALALADGGKLLYVADSGKYPQVVAFALNANAAINAASGTRDTGPIIYGQTVSGEINETTFINTYTFDGKAGDVITITMEPGDGSKIDPYIDLLGAKNVRLAANDDAKAKELPPTAARIKNLRLPVNATYTIRATRYGREATTTTGTYSLTLTLERVGKTQ